MTNDKQLKKAAKILSKSNKRAGDNRGLNQWDQSFLANIIKQGSISAKQRHILDDIKRKFRTNKDKRHHPGEYGSSTGSGCHMSGLDHDDMQGDWCDGAEY